MNEEHSRDWELEAYRADKAHIEVLTQATTAFEHAVLKPLFLLNGGALVVFVALMGALKFVVGFSATAAVIVWFLGLVSATFATGAGYRSQFAFRRAADRKLESSFNFESNRKATLEIETKPELGGLLPFLIVRQTDKR